jgi:hypothetical protein
MTANRREDGSCARNRNVRVAADLRLIDRAKEHPARFGLARHTFGERRVPIGEHGKPDAVEIFGHEPLCHSHISPCRFERSRASSGLFAAPDDEASAAIELERHGKHRFHDPKRTPVLAALLLLGFARELQGFRGARHELLVALGVPDAL